VTYKNAKVIKGDIIQHDNHIQAMWWWVVSPFYYYFIAVLISQLTWCISCQCF